MSPILGIIASSNFQRVTSSYESIATTTVGSGGASSVTFSSIPNTYTHLQVRAIARGTFSGTLVSFFMRINGETGSFYSDHHLGGDGSTTYAYAASTQTTIGLNDIAAATNTASAFSALVMDILDYKDTSKYKTTRGLLGREFNGTGQLELNSGLYQKTTAITSIEFYPGANNFAQYTQFALYGIKGA
jgi:hypothetical protein